ncbi:MAG: dolichyl-phosphate-mannose-protein mannosyltransferase [Actinomycetota bacterium]|jgi:dolichyl-phosphate-mannose--protein O-mannosyl transferase|nr:dolichyl-phosphate-mannose-protein mannosyltransferase [Actinomycetota bacterium]
MAEAETESLPPPDAQEHDSIHVPRWVRLDWIAMGGISLVAFVVRFINLRDPSSYVFDEVYYAKDACYYLDSSVQFCKLPAGYTDEQSYVHPPLAKWLIAIGERIFGYNALGWRIVPLIAGTLTVALLYVLARFLLRSILGASLASGLLAIDLLHFVQSRTSMLDIFVPLFGVAAMLFLVLDRERWRAEAPPPDTPEDLPDQEEDPPPQPRRLLARPWRLAAGICVGAATASKWNGGLMWAAVVVLTIAWEIAGRRHDERGHVLARAFLEEAPSIVLFLFIVPVVVYTLTYIGRIHGTLLGFPWSQGTWLRAFYDRQKSMYEFQRYLNATHSYQSPPWSWLLLKRPVSYFFCSGSSCTPTATGNGYQEIIATGSPFVWWSSILALIYVAWRWIRTRDFLGAEGLIITGFAFTYLTWVFLAADRPAVFIFYMLPTVPFMCLAIAYVGVQLGRSWEANTAIALFTATAVGLFVFYYPIVTKTTISQDAWKHRIWIFDNCDKPSQIDISTTETTTVNGRQSVIPTTTTTDSGSVPPGYSESWTHGWCWI